MQRNIYIYIWVTILFSSCLFEENDIFSESANERKQEAVKDFSEILKSASNGWLLEYYPQSSQAYGGYNYLIKFADKDAVDASFEYVRNPETVSSLYDVIYDYGPMLTFNTYNVHLHYFAEARNSQTLYQGYQGDYEFMIQEYDESNSALKLKGKKTSNYMWLKKLPDDVVWNEYLDAVNDTEMQWLFSDYELHVNGDSVGTALKSGRIITFSWNENGEDKTATSSLVYRPDGNIHFYKQAEIGDMKVQNFRYDSPTRTAESTDEGVNVTLKAVVAKDFVNYEDYLGNWTLTDYYGSTYTVTFSQEERNKTFKMTSESLKYTVYWNWSSSNSGKRLTLYCQVLEVTPEGNQVLLMPAYVNDTGGTSFQTGIGSSAAYYAFDGNSTIACTGGTNTSITGFIFYIRNSANTANVGWASSPNRFMNATLKR